MSDPENTGLVSAIGSSELVGGLKGKAQRAILRFLAGSLGHPYVREVKERLDEVEGRTRVNMLLAEAVARQAISDPIIMERAKARFLGDVYRKQANVEAIADAAAEQLRSESDEAVSSEDENAEPTDDWLNAFTKEAENASSEELRKRLGQLLAGEIRTPGSFSRATIRAVAEIEQKTLLDFQKILPRRIKNMIVPSVGWNQRDYFALAVSLEDFGLISGSAGTFSHNWNFDQNGGAVLAGDMFGLFLRGTPGTLKSMGIWLVSQIGLQIASLLSGYDERQALRIAANELDKSGIQKITIGRMNLAHAGQVRVIEEEQLWPTAPHPNLIFGRPI